MPSRQRTPETANASSSTSSSQAQTPAQSNQSVQDELSSQPKEPGLLDMLFSAFGPTSQQDNGTPTDQTSPLNYFGTSSPVLNPDGTAQSRPTGGTTQLDTTTQGWGDRSTVVGQTTYNTEGDATTASTHKDTTNRSLKAGIFGGSGTEDTVIRSTLNPAATAERVKQALLDSADGLNARAQELQVQIDMLADDATLSPDERRTLAAARGRARTEQSALYQQASKLQASAADLTPKNADTTAAKHGIKVEAAYDEKLISKTSNSSHFDAGLDGSLSRVQQATNTQATADGSVSQSQTSSTGIKANGGLFLTSDNSQQTTTVTGDATAISAEKQSAHAGLVMRDGETGIGGAASRSVTKDGVTTTANVNAELTDKGVGFGATSSKSQENGAITSSHSLGYKGGATVEVTPVPGTDPKQYNLVVSFSLGGTASAGEAAKNKAGSPVQANGSASGSVGLSGKAVFTHRMSHEEAKTYLKQLEGAEAGAAAPALPEFGLAQRMAALNANGADLANLGAVVSADAGKTMPDGNSVSLTLSAEASLSGGLNATRGANGAGFSAEGTRSQTRQITISRERTPNGAPRVVLSVGFDNASSNKGGANASAAGFTAGGKLGGSSGSGFSATFSLDPDAKTYDADYARIIGALTESSLRALSSDPTLAPLMQASTTKASDGDSHDLSFGTQGFTLGMGQSDGGSSDITRSKDGNSFAVSGFQDNHASLAYGDTTLFASGTTNTANASMDSAGKMSLDASNQRKDTTSNPLAKSSSATDDVGGLRKVVETGPKAALQRALTETFTHLSGYHVGHDDFEQLIVRAQDDYGWQGCATDLRVIKSWSALRRTLINPPVDKALADDPASAKRLAQAKALVGFYRAHGPDAEATVFNALQNWGTRADGSQRGLDQANLGQRYEFPDAIGKLKGEFDALGPLADGALAKVGALSNQEAQYYLGDVSKRLTALRGAIHGAVGFEDPRAKVEMLNELSRREALISVAASYLDGGTSTLISSPEADTSAKRAAVSRIESEFPGFRQSEFGIFAQLRSQSLDDAEGFFQSAAALSRSIGATGTTELLSQLEDLYKLWIPRVKALRTAYTAAGVPQSEWKVSAGPKQPRRKNTEPDVDMFMHYYKQDRYQAFGAGAAATEARYRNY